MEKSTNIGSNIVDNEGNLYKIVDEYYWNGDVEGFDQDEKQLGKSFFYLHNTFQFFLKA